MVWPAKCSYFHLILSRFRRVSSTGASEAQPIHTHPRISVPRPQHSPWAGRCGAGGAHLPDDGVVRGGDSVEDALDAPQRLLAPRGDAVEGFVVVFQGPAALAEGRAGNMR